jgi:hypothetical protein
MSSKIVNASMKSKSTRKQMRESMHNHREKTKKIITMLSNLKKFKAFYKELKPEERETLQDYKYNGYLSYKATEEDTRRIGELLGYKKETIDSFIEKLKTLNEAKKETLRTWFKRSGPKGKEGGWVDCNAPDGKGGYKACGRKEGEKRSKYPACRPTPAGCKRKGKGKTWGKTK